MHKHFLHWIASLCYLLLAVGMFRFGAYVPLALLTSGFIFIIVEDKHKFLGKLKRRYRLGTGIFLIFCSFALA